MLSEEKWCKRSVKVLWSTYDFGEPTYWCKKRLWVKVCLNSHACVCVFCNYMLEKQKEISPSCWVTSLTYLFPKKHPSFIFFQQQKKKKKTCQRQQHMNGNLFLTNLYVIQNVYNYLYSMDKFKLPFKKAIH